MPAPRFKTCRHISENVWQIKKLIKKQKAIILKLKKKTNKKQYDFSKQLQTIQKFSLFYIDQIMVEVKNDHYTFP